MPEILDEVRRLLDNGYREFVLTGVHLGHYGVEQNRGKPKVQLAAIVAPGASIAAVDGDFRLRLSSLEATEVTRELVETVAEFPDKSLSALSHLSAKRFGSDPARHATPLGARGCSWIGAAASRIGSPVPR